MGFNLFSDPELAQRQAQLDGQWYGLNQTIDECQLTASSAPFFSNFYADYQSWKDFFASGSDWTADSKHATDLWQTTLQDYTKAVAQYCGNATSDAGGQAYIPGVKDNPLDKVSWADEIKKDLTTPFTFVESFATKVGILIAVVIGAILFAIIYVAVKGNLKASASGVSVGGSS